MAGPRVGHFDQETLVHSPKRALTMCPVCHTPGKRRAKANGPRKGVLRPLMARVAKQGPEPLRERLHPARYQNGKGADRSRRPASPEHETKKKSSTCRRAFPTYAFPHDVARIKF